MGGEFVEGTVVSVLQARPDALGADADGDGLEQAHGRPGRRGGSRRSRTRTTEQLAVLAGSHVVDAGGRGLLVLLDSLTATVTGHRPDRRDYPPAALPATTDAIAPSPRPSSR